MPALLASPPTRHTGYHYRVPGRGTFTPLCPRHPHLTE